MSAQAQHGFPGQTSKQWQASQRLVGPAMLPDLAFASQLPAFGQAGSRVVHDLEQQDTTVITFVSLAGMHACRCLLASSMLLASQISLVFMTSSASPQPRTSAVLQRLAGQCDLAGLLHQPQS